MTTTAHVNLSLDEADILVAGILRHAGFAEDHVRVLTSTLVAGERDGCAAHGLYRTLGCVASLHNGKVVGDAVPQVHDQAPAIVRVDAAGGFSLLAFTRGLPLLLDKARDNGLAAMAINRCVHFSALWPEVEQITAAGLVALICNPSHAWVTPAGGHKPVLGTNPIAFGWPRAGQQAFVFDFATSAVARGEIELHRRAGRPIPKDWGVDSAGQATTDAQAVIEGGAMLTFGGHKGSALSAMIELIAGPLIGDLTSAESLAQDAGAGAAPCHGELILALDPHRFLGGQWPAYSQRAEAFFAAYQDSGARLPSQRRYQARARSLNEGVYIPRDLHLDLLKLLN
jgi:delta1-piperideine-2-carboxylate reductase